MNGRMNVSSRFLLVFFIFSLSLILPINAQNCSPLSALLPMPNEVEVWAEKAPFRLTAETAIVTQLPADEFCVKELQRLLNEQMQRDVPVAQGRKHSASVVELVLDASVEGKEHYILEVTKKKLSIKASTKAGLYYGVKTLEQILLGDVCRTEKGEVAALRVDDAPRFPRRALMLDPARHFYPVEDVKFFIEQMARYKYNVLQLHLTDDQGWRVEIESHPELTRLGGFCNPKAKGSENGFYTQQQLKEIIAYAAQRNVEVVPELDVPGHTTAIVGVFPELKCAHWQKEKHESGLPYRYMLCAANEQVYALYDDIIREVAALFPSQHIHLGGDESIIEKNWSLCPRCQELKKKLGYREDRQLMNEFFRRILTSVRKYGKQATLWCELDNIYMPANEYLFDYPKDVTLVTWRMGLTPKCIELTAAHGHDLLMAPGEYAYLDYPQLKGDLPEFNNWGMPITTLEKAYEFDPGYGLPEAEQRHIVGVMGTLWAEAMQDINRVTYMTYPRGLALAEAGWTQMAHRGWKSFCRRMYPNLQHLMKQGVSVRVPFEVVPR